MNKDTIVRHHLLEIILWPNEDGTFTEIRNSVSRLKELGIYNDFKMTIPITNSEHSALHHTGINGTNHPFYGKHHSDETKNKIGVSGKGRHWNLSKETKKRMCEAKKNMSEETKNKMSLAKKGLHKGKTWKLINGKRVWLEKEVL